MRRLFQRIRCALRGVHGHYESYSFRSGCYTCPDCGRWWAGDIRGITSSGRLSIAAARALTEKGRP